MRMTPKLLLAFLGVALVPILSFAFVSYGSWRDTYLKQFGERMLATAAIQEGRVNDIAQQNKERLLVFTTSSSLRETVDAYVRAEAINQNSSETNRLRDEMSALANEAKRSIEAFVSVSIFNPDGQIIASSYEVFPHIDYRVLEDVFQKGKQFNEISKAVRDNAGNTQVLLTGPIIYRGETVGVVVIESDAQNIYELTSDYRGLGETGETLIGQRLNTRDAIFITPLRFDQQAAMRRAIIAQETTVSDPLLNALNRREEYLADSIDYRGKRVITATRYADALGWGIAVKIDREEALLPLQSLRTSIYVTTITTSILVSFFAAVFARTLTTPLRRLAATADIIAKGDMTVRADESSSDEVGTLGKAFNRMLDILKRTNSTLEDRVRDRTMDLEEARKVTNEKLEEVERLNKVMVGREIRMIEMKKKLKENKSDNT